MRSLATGERALLGGARLAVKARAEVLDSDGTWRNVSALGGGALDFFHSAEWGANPDDPVQSATITLVRQVGTSNLAPLMGSSLINRNAASAYVPFLKENSRIRLYTAEGLPGFTPGSGAENSWHMVFDGKIDDVDVQRHYVVLSCRDIGAFLQQTSIELEEPYGTDPAPGQSLESIMQALINRWMVSAVTMVVPVASGASRTATLPSGKPYTIPVGNLMDALQSLASEIGWVCRYEWGTGDTYELRFYRPALKGSADTTFDPTEYLAINELKTSDADIRNKVKVVCGTVSATAADTASSGAPGNYGVRYMQLALDPSTGVDTVPELQRVADTAIADLSTPYASHRIETLYFWAVERGDLHAYPANNVMYDSTQSLYVVDFRHRIGKGTGRTTISARGKPVARFRTWFETFGAELLPDNSLLDVVATEYATTYSIAWGGTGVISLSIDGGAWVTPPATNPIVVNRNPENGATKIYRFRTVLGLDITYETIYVLPIGAVAPPPDLSVMPSTPATLSQSYTVTCTNPRAGGAAPTITVFAVGAGGTVALFGGGSATIVDGASPITVPSGSVVTMTRPAFASPAGNVIFRGIITGGGLAEIQRTVVSRQAIGPNLIVTPTPYVSTYSLAWSGDGVTLSIDGAAFAAPSASPIIVNRPAIGAADKIYTFKGTLDGQTVTNTVTIPAVGSPETPNLTVTLTTQTDTQFTFTVTATSPSSGAVPTILGYLKDATFGDSHTDGGAITSGDTVIVNRPANTAKRDGSFRVRASIGTSYEEIVNSVGPQVQLSFGPTLVVTPIPFATTYSIYFSGDSVLVDKADGNGFVSTGSSPMVVTRPSLGSPDLVYTFRGTKDGQEVTNSITIPAIGGLDSPNLNVTPSAPTSTQQSFVVTATAASGGTAPVVRVYFTGCTSSTHSDGDVVSSGATVTVNKPTFGNSAGSVRFRATLGAEFEEISRTIVTQIKTSFGPSMQLRTIVNNSTQCSIYWDDMSSGSTIEVNINGAGWGAPGTSPWVVSRPAAEGLDDVYAFRATKDGQTISDTVIVRAQNGRNVAVWQTSGGSFGVDGSGNIVERTFAVAWEFNSAINDTDHRVSLEMNGATITSLVPSAYGWSGTLSWGVKVNAALTAICTVSIYRPYDGKVIDSFQVPIGLTLVGAY